MIETHPLLTEKEISRIKSIVDNFENDWVERSDGFYTLGASSYLDAATESYEKYQQKADAINTKLREQLGFLYKKVEKDLEDHMGQKVTVTKKFAVPGFHIWLENGLPRIPGPTYHFDVQHLSIPWNGKETTIEETNRDEMFTFTLPIELPKAGGGLDIWDIDHSEIANQEVEDLIPRRKRYFCTYKLGKMVIHSGLKLHRVAVTSPIYEGDRRITLQGHGRLIDGQWVLYW
ncbi:hypothetical protein [Gracilimonas mengyeensis]|uniref:Fe2OG dioxygenase domain-containing protein n=1 Tax=Gracilimonas mengyeensis TaxID=1302730 RepID=A0A521EU90_9BACT|nr:hypothetical protein [Gracilimonas mengyeensis]SMO86680.1 hypothetical protein SAMN06265219_11379 [Gracilimonas mengyeensis]